MGLGKLAKRVCRQLEQLVTIVRCVGKHHKELLHEICDHFDAHGMEVLHADIDQEGGQDVHSFYITRCEEGAGAEPKKLGAEERAALREVIQALFASHGVSGTVTVASGEHPTNEGRSPSVEGRQPSPAKPGRPV